MPAEAEDASPAPGAELSLLLALRPDCIEKAFYQN
jgi:hypothetical protein